MNVKEYWDLLRRSYGKSEPPIEGMCPIVKERGMVIGPDCIKCSKFYIEPKDLVYSNKVKRGKDKLSGPPVKFVLRKGSFFFISDSGSEHRITKGAIIANGLQDLCIVKERREVFVKKISETDPKDIHYLPKGDILWLNFEPPLKGMISIVQDIGDDPENMRRLVKALLKYGDDAIKGKTYDMYAGDHY